MRTSNYPYIDFSFKCGQDWSAMENHGENKFCQSCQKTVIDFSKMSNSEAISFLTANAKKNTCGSMTLTQLAELNTRMGMQDIRLFSLKNLLLGAGISASASGFAQEKLPVLFENDRLKVELLSKDINPDSTINNLIRGTIVDENGLGIPYAKVSIPTMQINKQTDADGKFEIFYDAHLDGNIHLNVMHEFLDSTIVAKELEDKEILITISPSAYLINLPVQGQMDFHEVGGILTLTKGQRIKYSIRRFFQFKWLHKNEES
jgi:hypothetical protein